MSNIVKLCIAGIVITVVALFVFKIPANNLLFFALLLACPLMHIFMGHGSHNENDKKIKIIIKG